MSVVFDSATPFTQARLNLVKAAGGVAVCRYLKKQLPNSYELYSDERTLILGNGLGLKYNAEQSAGDIVNQSAAWWHDYGAECGSQLAGWKVPTGRGVTVAVSADQAVVNVSLAVTNFAAFLAGITPYGYGMNAYAPTNVLDALLKLCPPPITQWLPAAIGWSPGYRNADGSYNWAAYLAYPHAGIVQRVGSAVAGTDSNTIIDLTNFGMDWGANPWPNQPTPAPPTQGDEDMFLLMDPIAGDDPSGAWYKTDGLRTLINIDAIELAWLEGNTFKVVPENGVQLDDMVARINTERATTGATPYVRGTDNVYRAAPLSTPPATPALGTVSIQAGSVPATVTWEASK